MTTRNFVIDQGSSYRAEFDLETQAGAPFDLTSYDCRLQVRASYGATSTLINATLSNGGLTKSGNKVTWLVTPSDTSAIRFPGRDDAEFETVYDLEIVSMVGEVFKPSRGTVTFRREVTR